MSSAWLTTCAICHSSRKPVTYPQKSMDTLLIRKRRNPNLRWAEGRVMSWKREGDGLIGQTLAFVQSFTSRRDGTSTPETTAPLPLEAKAVRPSVGAVAVETALGAAVAPSAIAIASPTVTPKFAPQSLRQPSVAPTSPAAQRPIAPSEVAAEIRARIAGFRAHQERFNRERDEYFSATLARLRAAIKDARPPRPGK
jgi:hypothetical protein